MDKKPKLEDPAGLELVDILREVKNLGRDEKSKLSEDYFSEFKEIGFEEGAIRCRVNNWIIHLGEDEGYISDLKAERLGIRYSDLGGKEGIASLKLAILKFYEEQLRNV